MFDDLLLDDDPENPPLVTGGLVVPATLADRELRICERVHRFAAIAATKLIFTMADDDGSNERWEPTVTIDRETGIQTTRYLDAESWQAIMSWPREPTIAEALAYQANARARLAVDTWEAMQRGSAVAAEIDPETAGRRKP